MIQLYGHLCGTRNPVDIWQISSRCSRAQEQLSQCFVYLEGIPLLLVLCFFLFFFFIQERRKHMDYFKTLQTISKRQFWFRLHSVHVVPSVLKRNKGYFQTIFWITVQITLKQLKRSSFELMGEKLHWIIHITKITIWLTLKGRFSYFG